MTRLPTGTVTLFFTDLRGSTDLLRELGNRYASVLAEFRGLLRRVIEAHQGSEVDTQGDALFAVFPRAKDGVRAAVATVRAMVQHPWPEGAQVLARIGLHTGEPVVAETGYVGLDVHRAARICAAAHGGQIVLSQTAYDLVVDDPPDGITLIDLGEHQLKDFDRPQRLYRIAAPDLPADFPPLRTLEGPRARLPQPLTNFIGRERTIASLIDAFDTSRLVTLTGIGGAGKTRLAIQLAGELADRFPDGIWFVELGSLADPALVPQMVAETLGIREQPGRPLRTTLVDAFRHKRSLIALDNCEHLIAACGALVVELLQGCLWLTVLATSRHALDVEGELVYPVPPLAMPEPSPSLSAHSAAEYEAVQLFVERARSVAPSFSLSDRNVGTVAELCRRLDGMPLAIELAAARLKVLSVEQILDRLSQRFRLLTADRRDRPPRHQTLRATMDWSFQLLTDQEQRLLRRLSVFAGGFALDAAEQVTAGAGIESSEVLDLLAELVDKSLVMVEPHDGSQRYRLLETIREYSLERLGGAGEEAALRDRHRDWYISFALQADAEVHGHHAPSWLERLDTDHDNLRAALAWCQERTDPTAGLRLAAALGWFWYLRGYPGEGRMWLARFLPAADDAGIFDRAKALNRAGILAWSQSDYVEAIRFLQAALQLLDQVSAPIETSLALNILGNIAYQPHGDYAQARGLFEQASATSKEAGDQWGMAFSLHNLGRVLWRQGIYDRAAALLEESRRAFEAVGDRLGMAWALHSLGLVARSQGELDQAETNHMESLELFRELNEKAHYAVGVNSLGALARLRGDYARALALSEESTALFRELGDKAGIALSLYSLSMAALCLGHLDRALAQVRESLALRRELGDWRGVAESLEGVAAVAAARDPERAACLTGAAEALREHLGTPLPPSDRAGYDQMISALHAALGEGGFVKARNRGRAMSKEQAIVHALGE